MVTQLNYEWLLYVRLEFVYSATASDLRERPGAVTKALGKYRSDAFRNERRSSCIYWKACTEHGGLAFRLLLGRLVLQHIPVLGKKAVFYP